MCADDVRPQRPYVIAWLIECSKILLFFAVIAVWAAPLALWLVWASRREMNDGAMVCGLFVYTLLTFLALLASLMVDTNRRYPNKP